MKIAVGTDDRKTLHKGDLCGSRYFAVLEILNAEVVGDISCWLSTFIYNCSEIPDDFLKGF